MVRTLIGFGLIGVGYYVASIGEPGGGAPTQMELLGGLIIVVGATYLGFRTIKALPHIPFTRKSGIIAAVLFIVTVAIVVLTNLLVSATVQAPIVPVGVK